MGTGRALVWFSPKSYPNQTHIRELKEKKNNNNNKKALHNAIYFYRFSFYLKVGFYPIKQIKNEGGLLIWFALLFFTFNVARCPN